MGANQEPRPLEAFPSSGAPRVAVFSRGAYAKDLAAQAQHAAAAFRRADEAGDLDALRVVVEAAPAVCSGLYESASDAAQAVIRNIIEARILAAATRKADERTQGTDAYRAMLKRVRRARVQQ